MVILKAAGLSAFLLSQAAAEPVTPARASTTVTRAGATYQIFPQAVAAPLACTVVGRPDQLATSVFTEADCRAVAFKSGAFGLGLGAFGQGFADCRDRFGEFLAVGGCAITLPTNDRHALPDYVIEEGALVPTVQTLYALTGSGDFSSMVRFDAAADGPGAVGLSAFVEAVVEFSEAPATAFVVLAETAGLVGATLRQSPAASQASLELPGVRDWLSFTTERSSERGLALLVGVAAREVPPDAQAFLRPMRGDSAVQAHIHAAVFPYRPVQRGELPFGQTLSDALTGATPSGVLHLMADTRSFEGVGETDLVRGACWLGPLPTITRG